MGDELLGITPDQERAAAVLMRMKEVDREAFEQTPPFLRGKSLKPFISEELIAASSPIKFRTPKGNLASGYRAELLPQICEVLTVPLGSLTSTDQNDELASCQHSIS